MQACLGGFLDKKEALTSTLADLLCMQVGCPPVGVGPGQVVV